MSCSRFQVASQYSGKREGCQSREEKGQTRSLGVRPQPSLDQDSPSFGQVLLANLGQLAPGGDLEPDGLLARRAIGVGPLAVGGYR